MTHIFKKFRGAIGKHFEDQHFLAHRAQAQASVPVQEPRSGAVTFSFGVATHESIFNSRNCDHMYHKKTSVPLVGMTWNMMKIIVCVFYFDVLATQVVASHSTDAEVRVAHNFSQFPPSSILVCAPLKPCGASSVIMSVFSVLVYLVFF